VSRLRTVLFTPCDPAMLPPWMSWDAPERISWEHVPVGRQQRGLQLAILCLEELPAGVRGRQRLVRAPTPFTVQLGFTQPPTPGSLCMWLTQRVGSGHTQRVSRERWPLAGKPSTRQSAGAYGYLMPEAAL